MLYQVLVRTKCHNVLSIQVDFLSALVTSALRKKVRGRGLPHSKPSTVCDCVYGDNCCYKWGFEDRNKPSLFHPTIFLVSFLLEVTQNTIEKRTTFGLDSWNFLGKDSLVLLKPLFVYRVKDPSWEPLPVTQPELHRAALGE